MGVGSTNFDWSFLSGFDRNQVIRNKNIFFLAFIAIQNTFPE